MAPTFEILLTDPTYLPAPSSEFAQKFGLFPSVLRAYGQVSGYDTTAMVSNGILNTMATMGMFSPGLQEATQNTVEAITSGLRLNTSGSLQTFAEEMTRRFDDIAASA